MTFDNSSCLLSLMRSCVALVTSDLVCAQLRIAYATHHSTWKDAILASPYAFLLKISVASSLGSVRSLFLLNVLLPLCAPDRPILHLKPLLCKPQLSLTDL